MQDRLDGWLTGPVIDYIEAAGDLLKTQSEGDGILRVGLQHIRGMDMDNSFAVAPELDAMDKIGTDVQGMVESNKPWTPQNKVNYKIQL